MRVGKYSIHVEYVGGWQQRTYEDCRVVGNQADNLMERKEIRLSATKLISLAGAIGASCLGKQA
jgi:hypothetical protein